MLKMRGLFALMMAVAGLQAHAELVFDDPQSSAETEAPAPRVEERESTRRTLRVADQGAVTQAAQSGSSANSVDVTDAVNVTNILVPEIRSQAQVQADTQAEMLSRSELLRRKRMRNELQTEDLLQQRLEELRLKDEERRMGKIINSKALGGEEEVAPKPSAPIAEQVVEVPLIERTRDEVRVVQAAPEAPSTSSAQVPVEGVASAVEEKSSVYLSPRFGMPSMANADGYNVSGRYGVGAVLGVETGENLSFELGYAFNEYGVAINSWNPWVLQYQGVYGSGRTAETIAMKQNVIDATIKLSVLGKDYKLRPFVSLGGGYTKSFINYDSKIVDWMRQTGFYAGSDDYEVSQFVGSLGGGVDLKLSKSVSINAMFKYSKILSSRENYALNNYAFYGNAQYGYPYNLYNPYGQQDYDKQQSGASLAKSDFYTITAGVNLAF
jgi:hypothetical protein